MEADRMKPGNEIINMFLNVVRSRQQGVAQIEEMKRFAAENPNDLNVRMSLVQILSFARRMNEAQPYIEEILRAKPKDFRFYQALGTVYSTAGNYEKAAEVYRESLKINANDPAAHLGMATIYAKNGQVEEAIKAYDKVFEIKPDSPNIMKLYADFLRDNGKRCEALAMYKRSLTMLPNNSPALFNAGVLSAKLGDVDSAKQYLETLRTVDAKTAKILQRFLSLK
jgi:Tfp pilus assembly protein PilF